VQFITIYTIEAHPVGCASPYSSKESTSSASRDAASNPLYQPFTYEERVAQATQCRQEMGETVPLLVDGMDNAVWCTYGPAPNIAYLIGQDGKIVTKQGWYQPEQMEKVLQNYLKNGLS
jgi:hypothetical protein